MGSVGVLVTHEIKAGHLGWRARWPCPRNLVTFPATSHEAPRSASGAALLGVPSGQDTVVPLERLLVLFCLLNS